jgi:hypothetical protein
MSEGIGDGMMLGAGLGVAIKNIAWGRRWGRPLGGRLGGLFGRRMERRKSTRRAPSPHAYARKNHLQIILIIATGGVTVVALASTLFLLRAAEPARGERDGSCIAPGVVGARLRRGIAFFTGALVVCGGYALGGGKRWVPRGAARVNRRGVAARAGATTPEQAARVGDQRRAVFCSSIRRYSGAIYAMRALGVRFAEDRAKKLRRGVVFYDL